MPIGTKSVIFRTNPVSFSNGNINIKFKYRYITDKSSHIEGESGPILGKSINALAKSIHVSEKFRHIEEKGMFRISPVILGMYPDMFVCPHVFQ